MTIKIEKVTFDLAEGEAEAIGTDRCKRETCQHLVSLHHDDDGWETCAISNCDCHGLMS